MAHREIKPFVLRGAELRHQSAGDCVLKSRSVSPGPVMMVIVAVAALTESATEVAVIITEAGLGKAAGAVYIPSHINCSAACT